MKELNSVYQLGEIIPNIATFLKRNVVKFHDKYVYQEKNTDGVYEGIIWKYFYNDIKKIAGNLEQLGFKKGDKMILFSGNRLEMLELEMAIMAFGGIAVPIYSHFKQATAELLINHSCATWMAVAGQEQIDNIGGGLTQLKSIFHFDKVDNKRYKNLIPFTRLKKDLPIDEASCLSETITTDTICLNMYTSGTMGIPKCVQLTHKNILSQQAALDVIWDVDENDRFLAYLPWHHSFGGIFELFTILYSGATLFLESSFGKDVDSIFENWKLVQPTISLVFRKFIMHFTRKLWQAKKPKIDSLTPV